MNQPEIKSNAGTDTAAEGETYVYIDTKQQKKPRLNGVLKNAQSMW